MSAKVELVKMVIRIPADMREKIQAVAEKSRRSMNSEVVYRLEASLEQVTDDFLARIETVCSER